MRFDPSSVGPYNRDVLAALSLPADSHCQSMALGWHTRMRSLYSVGDWWAGAGQIPGRRAHACRRAKV
jgi:hypothetical protein